MKRFLAMILVCLLVTGAFFAQLAVAESPVPDKLPEDLGGKTKYGYLMGLKEQYLPTKVFTDPVKYQDADRENARRAITLVIAAVTEQFENTGKTDQYYLYLRGYCYELGFIDSGDPALRENALADYKATVDAGGAYAQKDYDRASLLVVNTFPLLWEMPQALAAAEFAGILGLPEIDVGLIAYAGNDPVGGKPGVCYFVKITGDTDSRIVVFADTVNGKNRYDVLHTFAMPGTLQDAAGVGDKAFLCKMTNLNNSPLYYTAFVVLKGSLALTVLVPDTWRASMYTLDTGAFAQAIAERVLANMGDVGRAVPAAGVAIEAMPEALALATGDPSSPVPDAIPSDLGGKTVYGYVTDTRKQYLPSSVFTNTDKYTDADRNNARRAAKLLVSAISAGFDAYGVNMYDLEIRGYCYALMYADTGNIAFRALAVNDYKNALGKGYSWAKADFDRLATEVLAPLNELKAGSNGDDVLRLQEWLMYTGYLKEATGTFDTATEAAVKGFEAEAGLTADGIADIAVILALYARIPY